MGRSVRRLWCGWVDGWRGGMEEMGNRRLQEVLNFESLDEEMNRCIV